MSGMEIFAIAAVASAAMGAMSSIQQGKAMEQRMNAEARVAELQGRVDAANYRMEGARALARANELAATQAARAGAAGHLPTQLGGLGGSLQLNTMRYGIEDMNSAIANQMISLGMSQQQAGSLRIGGKNYRRQKTFEGLTTLAQGAGKAAGSGAFGG